MIGKILSGRYKITKTLGSGGFGQTFLAEDTQIPGNPICVVKQLKPLSNSPEQLAKAKELFKQEAEKLVQLGRHDQIPELLASFQDGDDLFLIQQYIEGQTLDTELQPGQIWPEQKVIQFLLDLLPVLDFIHKARTIHRDIKPPNIIRRKHDNKPVLIDFGAVKEVQAQVGDTIQPTMATGTVIGTRGYMSTEQGQGKPRPSSDIYALGMICIQALTGKMPTQLDDDVDTGELVWKHLVQASPGLKQVIEKMTRYHFRDRSQSAAEVLDAVQSLATENYSPTEAVTNWVPPTEPPTPVPPPMPAPIPIPDPPSPNPQPAPVPEPADNKIKVLLLGAVVLGLSFSIFYVLANNSNNPVAKKTEDENFDQNCRAVITETAEVRDHYLYDVGKLKRGTKINYISKDREGWVEFDGVDEINELKDKNDENIRPYVHKDNLSPDCKVHVTKPQPSADLYRPILPPQSEQDEGTQGETGQPITRGDNPADDPPIPPSPPVKPDPPIPPEDNPVTPIEQPYDNIPNDPYPTEYLCQRLIDGQAHGSEYPSPTDETGPRPSRDAHSEEVSCKVNPNNE